MAHTHTKKRKKTCYIIAYWPAFVELCGYVKLLKVTEKEPKTIGTTILIKVQLQLKCCAWNDFIIEKYTELLKSIIL